MDGLEAERTRHGAPPRPGYPEKAQEELNALNTLHANRKLAESQLEEARRRRRPGLRRGSPVPRPDPRRGLGAGQRRRGRRRAAGPKQAGLYAGGILLLAVGAVGLIATLCGTLPLPLGSLPAVLTTAGGVRRSGYRGAALLIAAGLWKRRFAAGAAELLARYGAERPEIFWAGPAPTGRRVWWRRRRPKKREAVERPWPGTSPGTRPAGGCGAGAPLRPPR